MISRRNFLNVTLMMMALFFLFQFTVVVKENWKQYETNEYMSEKNTLPEETPEASLGDGNFVGESQKTYIVLVSDTSDESLIDVVKQWCKYSKRTLYIYDDLEAYTKAGKSEPELLLLDKVGEEDIPQLQQLVKEGISLCFCHMPDYAVVSQNETLRSILGIKECILEETTLTGIHLFEGFLLGGEAIYEPEKEEEQKLQDMDLKVPWYVLDSETKAYMVGLKSDMVNAPKNEQLPPIIWRHSADGTMVFAVVGDYMQQITGMGILSAMVAEKSVYELYPVVNAQNMTIVNFPGLASENKEEMEQIYARTQQKLMRDVIWPGLEMIRERSGVKYTYLFATQFDYTDGNEPQTEDLIYYHKLMKEGGAEAGISLDHKESISLSEKMERDALFWESTENSYIYGSYYVKPGELKQFADGLKLPKEVRTVASDYEEGSELFSFLTEDITVQRATANGYKHTYQDNFKLRSLETALGYSHIMVDLNDIYWPDTKDDRWEILSDELAKNTGTYWKAFKEFEQTVLLESDTRVRNFLALDYEHYRLENCITLQVENLEQQAWFILRMHGEDIADVQGGTYKQIEKDVYLIEATGERVEIVLEEQKIRVEP